jgi:nucleotide-binding universal stress UspA family protein
MNVKNESHPYLNVGGAVLAAVDASVYTESTSHYAAWAASRLEAPLEFVHVLDRHPEHAAHVDLSGNLALDERNRLLDELATLDETRSRLGQEQGRLLLQQAKGVAMGMHGIVAETRLRHGSLVDTLTELEAGVRLFVLGKRGEHADFAKGHLGGELERVVRAVHRPLLVCSRRFQPVERVLVAFDGSATTRKGIEMLAASPLFNGLVFQVLMVGSTSESNAQQVQWAVDTLRAGGADAQGLVLPGDADDVISRHVRDDAIDLLVMGAYGHSKIRRLIVGSTTTTLLRECHVPVLLLR